MFWMMVLPFFITLLMMVAFIIAATIYAKSFGKRAIVFALSVVAAFLLFIPTCNMNNYVIDQFRFGTFTYASYDDILYLHRKEYLPDQAKNIMLISDGGGFKAQYEISREDLDAYIENFLSYNKGEGILLFLDFGNGYSGIEREYFETIFEDIGWKAPDDLVPIKPVLWGNGAGFSIWHSESEGMAYERAGYW